MTSSGSPLVNSPGALTVITVANPSAGADWTYTVPAGHRLRVLSIYFELASDANTGARTPTPYITDGTDALYRGKCATASTASSTSQIVWAPNLEYTAGTINAIPAQAELPNPCILTEGWTIGSKSYNIQAADQLQNIRITVLDWLVT